MSLGDLKVRSIDLLYDTLEYLVFQSIIASYRQAIY